MKNKPKWKRLVEAGAKSKAYALEIDINRVVIVRLPGGGYALASFCGIGGRDYKDECGGMIHYLTDPDDPFRSIAECRKIFKGKPFIEENHKSINSKYSITGEVK